MVQTLQVIKGLLTPVIPCDSHCLLAPVLPEVSSCRGLSYLHKHWNEPSVIPHKPQEILDIIENSRGRPFLMASILLSLVAISLVETICPK